MQSHSNKSLYRKENNASETLGPWFSGVDPEAPRLRHPLQMALELSNQAQGTSCASEASEDSDVICNCPHALSID